MYACMICILGRTEIGRLREKKNVRDNQICRYVYICTHIQIGSLSVVDLLESGWPRKLMLQEN